VRIAPPVTLFLLFARIAVAQSPGVRASAPGATVSGVVRDSIARIPLAGAWVQLVAADSQARSARTVASDSLGRFTIADVQDGRYALGFFHPLLDSLGVEPPPREVVVSRHRSVRADLATPSPARLRTAICGSPPASPAGGVVVGTVRDALGGTPAKRVTVIGEWLVMTFRPGGVDRRRPRLVVRTGDNGWFALCNVPSGGTMFLMAGRGADSTDVIEVQVPKEGFLRRELYLGLARTVVVGDTTPRADTLAPRADTLAVPPRRVRMGDGRLRGTVVTAEGSRPLAGAVVRITDGSMTRANDHGEWSLVDVPAGTRVLEVRAVGYYAVRRVVDVVADAAPVAVALSTFKAMLDTVRVTAARVADRHNSGFEVRRRSGIGNYLTPADIVRRGAFFTSDIFRQLRGIRLGYAYDTLATDMTPLFSPESIDPTDRRILMRGITGNWCAPAIYLDGLYMSEFTADALDSWVSPERIAGIEVYSEVAVPPDYQRARSGCGSILIWTK